MRSKRVAILVVVLLALVASYPLLKRAVISAMHHAQSKRTVEDRTREFAPAVRDRLRGDFDRVGVAFPPPRIVLAAFKKEQTLEVWVGQEGAMKLLRAYPIRAASGLLGPKLRERDMQVPEGLYRIESLNPNSLFHLALRVGYPNEFDRRQAKLEGRKNLGGDIMIHGGSASIGCLAMGDPAAEDLFVLAAETGLDNVSVLISPVDFRVADLPKDAPAGPAWTTELYGQIRRALAELK